MRYFFVFVILNLKCISRFFRLSDHFNKGISYFKIIFVCVIAFFAYTIFTMYLKFTHKFVARKLKCSYRMIM